MLRLRLAQFDEALIGGGENATDRESPMFGASQNSGALNALLWSTEAENQGLAENLSDLVPFDEIHDSPNIPLNGLAGGNGGLGLEIQSSNPPLQANDLPDWHILTTDGTVLGVDYNPGSLHSFYDSVDGSHGFVVDSKPGQQLSSAGDVMFLDFESYAKPADSGGGGNGGGGNGGGKGKNGGGGSGEPTDPNVISEYISGDPDGYNIEITFGGSNWTSDLQQAFIDSAEWISGIITSDVADVRYRGDYYDDITISADLIEIDGAGSILGQAGPTVIRTADYLPVEGIMEFDIADALDYYNDGLWDDIVLHEMLHTVGVGSLWDLNGFVDTSIPGSPTYTGDAAVLAYQDLFDGTGDVPLEYGYGAGTDLSHWDEEVFGNELMTGFIGDAYGSTTNYVSGMTVASLLDLGYSVDVESFDQQVELVV